MRPTFFLTASILIVRKGGGAMAVYLDLVIILNFLVDLLLLLGANRLSGYPSAIVRCAVSAAIGLYV